MIKQKTNLRNQGIILISSDSIQDIYKQSGELAEANEFQVHFWSLNLRYKSEKDGSILDICIPTAFFNYEQDVSGARIDFDLKDVDEISDTVKPIADMKTNELISAGIEEDIGGMFNLLFESMSVNLNSIHRHPGGMNQSFSVTDLNKKSSEPGVVFPLSTGIYKPNFAGIMAVQNDVCKIAHFEYRLANGDIKDKITYEKGRCITVVYGKQSELSSVEKIVGVPQKEDEHLYDNSYSSHIEQELKNILNRLEFKPSTHSVLPQNLTKKTYKTTITKSYNFNNTKRALNEYDTTEYINEDMHIDHPHQTYMFMDDFQDESEKYFDIMHKRDELLMIGVPQEEIDLATDYTILRWHKEVYGED